MNRVLRDRRTCACKFRLTGGLRVNRLPRLAVCACILLTALPEAYATERSHTTGVQRVFPQSDATLYLTFASDSSFCTSTSSPDRYTVQVGQNAITADGLRGLHALFLTAIAAGKQVTFYYDDATTSCYINRAVILK
jgi:hypothetical protein